VDSGANQAAFVAEATNSVVNVGSTYLGVSAVPLALVTGSTERARIDTSGRLLVGTSSTSSVARFVAQGSTTDNAGVLDIAYNGAATGLVSGNTYGAFRFTTQSSSPSTVAEIVAVADAATSAGDFPSRLVFSTTADGASSPTERMRINNVGGTKFTNNGTSRSTTGAHVEIYQSTDSYGLWTENVISTFTFDSLILNAHKAASSDFRFLRALSGNAVDVEFNLRGDGQAYADGSWNAGGADYAEYFEWSDGNADEEDRRGISVVLDDDKIRPAVAGEDPIGVISGNPSVVGDAAWNKWSGKYLRDEFGTYIQEDYEVEDEDGNAVVQQRRKLNPAYDPDQEYVSREQRPEWDCVGLMGKLRIRKGQPTGSRWIKMRDISDSVEEWLVR
jgi:hypothetical protein